MRGTIRYLSLCSGIEAASVACQYLGWSAVAFSEIEPFPCAVLQHHYQHVPNLGDMTKIDGSKYRGTVDLIVGGTPCQSFSVAGKRVGISDPRGALALAFVRLVHDVQPRWLVWENVPGVFSSNGGQDFKEFATALVQCGYHVAWRVLDAQYFGVPQRRRRVFLVGYFGDWRPAAAVLFEPHSLRGHSTPRGKKAKNIAGTIEASIARSRGAGTSPESLTHVIPINTQIALRHNALGERTGMGIGELGEVAFTLQSAHSHAVAIHCPQIVPQAMSCKWAKGTSGPAGDEHHNLVVSAYTQSSHGGYREGTGTVRASGGDIGGGSETIVAFHGSQDPDVSGLVTHPLGRNQGQEVCIAFAQNQLGEVRSSDVCNTINTNSNASGRNTPMIHQAMQVRRLTPLECERLQGFPDHYTGITYRNKPAADGPRYKALGNSMAVPVMRWIFERIEHNEVPT